MLPGDYWLTSVDIKSLNNYIEKLTIDVFGFSRGAATARYAIHVIFNGRISGVNEDTGDAQYEWQPVFHRLNRFDFIIAEKAVEVGFAGLYDTVLSYAGSQKIPWTTNALQQRAVARAKKVLHLAAADEHRADFSLHKIKSAVDKGVGEEYFLPGVHSDIGGSYNLANEKLLEQLELSKFDESEIQYMRTSDEGCKDLERNWWGKISDKTMVIHKGDPARLKEDRDELVKEGWYTEKEITIVDLAWDDLGQATQSMLTVFRQGIRSAYCNIPLKIMAKYARGKDVKLIINSKLEDRANTILKPERDLRDLEEKIIAYIDSKCESKPEHWMGFDALTKYPELKSIRHRHFHFSASKWSAGYNPRFEWDKGTKTYKRKRYYYDA